MPNNILITPGSASIQFSGSAANTIRLQVEASGSVAFYGNSGSLFGISDSLSGSLMSVNDISGLPILEVFSDDRVVMGSFNRNTLVVTGSRVGIDKAVPTADLDISGSVFVTGSLSMNSGGITGSLFGTSSWAQNAVSSSFATTASYAISSSVSLRSAVQSTGSAPSTPINNELWYDNNTGKTYIYYVSGSVGQWVLQSDPTYDPGPSLQNLQDVTDLGSITNNVITITNTTPSTSTTTGALKVSGGVGVSGSIYAEKLTATQISGSIVSASAYIGQKSSVIYVIDGGGLTIQTGIKGDLYIPFDCTVTEWVLLTDQVGSIVIDVWSDIYGSYPPTIADSIAGTDLPTLSGVNKNKSTALTGWNQNISAGSTLRFNVNSVSSVTRVTLTLNVTKT